MEELDAFEKRLRAVLEEGAETPSVDVRALAGASAAKAARRRSEERRVGKEC